jgi:hypothetical protein
MRLWRMRKTKALGNGMSKCRTETFFLRLCRPMCEQAVPFFCQAKIFFSRLRRPMCGTAMPFRQALIFCRGIAAPIIKKTASERHSLSAHRRAQPFLLIRKLAPARAVFAVALIAFSSCTPNRRIIESARTPEPPPVSSTPAVSGLEADLQAMRNADFTFILLFRRKDGAVMDAEDKAVINFNTPPEVNRRTLSDGGKAVIIGSNFPFLPGTIENLTGRFVMEDHSKPDAGPLEEDRSGNGVHGDVPLPNANTGRKANMGRKTNANK